MVFSRPRSLFFIRNLNMRLLLTVFIFLVYSGHCQAVLKLKNPTKRILFTSAEDNKDARHLYNILTKCQDFVNSRIIAIDPDSPFLHVQLGGTPATADSKRFLFIQDGELKTNDPVPLLERIFTKMIHRNVYYSGFTKENEIPRWILAGIIFNFQYEQQKWNAAQLVITRHAIKTQNYGDLEILLNDQYAPGPENPLLYKIYREQCGILLIGLNRLTGKHKMIYSFMTNERTTSFLSYLKINSKKFPTDDDISKWHKSLCEKSVFGNFLFFTSGPNNFST